MKNFIPLCVIVLLTGCAHSGSGEQTLNLRLSPSANKVVTENRGFMITGKDLRPNPHLAITQDGKQTYSSALAPAYLLQNSLAEQFSAQGFSIAAAHNNVVNIDVLEGLAKIDQNVFSHKINTKVTIKVTALNQHGTFSKTYSGNAEDKGVSLASKQKVNLVLNRLFSAVLQDVSEDPELYSYINENF